MCAGSLTKHIAGYGRSTSEAIYVLPKDRQSECEREAQLAARPPFLGMPDLWENWELNSSDSLDIT